MSSFDIIARVPSLPDLAISTIFMYLPVLFMRELVELENPEIRELACRRLWLRLAIAGYDRYVNSLLSHRVHLMIRRNILPPYRVHSLQYGVGDKYSTAVFMTEQWVSYMLKYVDKLTVVFDVDEDNRVLFQSALPRLHELTNLVLFLVDCYDMDVELSAEDLVTMRLPEGLKELMIEPEEPIVGLIDGLQLPSSVVDLSLKAHLSSPSELPCLPAGLKVLTLKGLLVQEFSAFVDILPAGLEKLHVCGGSRHAQSVGLLAPAAPRLPLLLHTHNLIVVGTEEYTFLNDVSIWPWVSRRYSGVRGPETDTGYCLEVRAGGNYNNCVFPSGAKGLYIEEGLPPDDEDMPVPEDPDEDADRGAGDAGPEDVDERADEDNPGDRAGESALEPEERLDTENQGEEQVAATAPAPEDIDATPVVLAIIRQFPELELLGIYAPNPIDWNQVQLPATIKEIIWHPAHNPIPALLLDLPRLERLSLRDVTFDSSFEALSKLTTLARLLVSNCKFDPSFSLPPNLKWMHLWNDEPLPECLKDLTQLTSLDVRVGHDKQKDLSHLEISSFPPCLTSLSIYMSYNLWEDWEDEEGWRRWWAWLVAFVAGAYTPAPTAVKSFASLTQLELLLIQDTDFSTIARLEFPENLNSLCICYCLNQVLDVVKFPLRLKTLELSGCEIKDVWNEFPTRWSRALRWFSQFLARTLSQLTFLLLVRLFPCLFGTKLRSARCPFPASLEVLDMNYNEQFRPPPVGVGFPVGLRELRLRRNQITDISLFSFPAGLRELDLNYNTFPIPEDYAWPKSLKLLMLHMDTDELRLTDERLDRFDDELPGVEIQA